MATMAERMKSQTEEFDAVAALASAYNTLRRIPVVDDDYPEYKLYYRRAVEDAMKAFQANGRKL